MSKLCQNCDKQISLDKFILHEPFCVRLIKKCDICGEPVSIEEMEDHITENHKLSDCGDCGKKLEKRLLSSHKKKCLEKLSICMYCELSMPKSDLHEHEYVCGSKTETCHLCGILVPLMEYDLHVEYICNKSPIPPIITTNKNNNNISNFISPSNYSLNSIYEDKKLNSQDFEDEYIPTTKNNSKKHLKPLNKKQNFDEYLINIKKLEEEMSKTKKTVEHAKREINNINNVKRNGHSNNIEIKNKKIDEFIYSEEEVYNLPELKNNKLIKTNEKITHTKNNKKNKNNHINNKNNISKKLISTTSNINYDQTAEDSEDDILQQIIELSKNEK